MDTPDLASIGGQPVDETIRTQLLEPFVAATYTALSEMAATEAIFQQAIRAREIHFRGDVAAVIELESGGEKRLVLDFPQVTAAALTKRILDGVAAEIDDGLVRDCVGEIANVVAGQAKVLLAETPHHFSFSVPKVVFDGASNCDLAPDQACYMISFNSDVGEFTLQLVW